MVGLQPQRLRVKQHHTQNIENELLLFLPAEPTRDISLGLCRLLLNSPIHLVDLVAGVLAESIELILAILG